MKRLLCLLPAVVLLSLAACSGLSGCSTMPLGDPGAIAATTLSDEKALFAAEAAINGVSEVAFAVAQSGVLPPAQSLAVADKLELAWNNLQDARCIHAALNGLPVPNERCAAAIAKGGGDYRALALSALAIAGDVQSLITTAKGL